ncbi:hypothetical protein [Bradyrhizobium liaoningense]|uniref:hypothetical protein n=1 Tax=Bradyrhizobium liaoningense TaxID=43992 RepID=UPI001BA61479|nr:hypothetical protein [Bradyrhizobium liaoningense]MBR1032809.1 hypothetical protein [Bradyrhizobium liaoningense]
MPHSDFLSRTHFLWPLLGVAIIVDSGIATAESINHCRTMPQRVDALDFPSRHAWNLFMVLNHPAADKTIARGSPDCAKQFGTPGTTSVWETWRLARTEVFLRDGSEPPQWSDLSLPAGTGGVGQTPEETFHVATNEPKVAGDSARPSIQIDTGPNQGVFTDRGGIGETHMNKVTYEFIKQNCLWSSDGLRRYAKAFVDGKKPPLMFPADSIEVKAVWLEFTPQAIQEGKPRRYYTAREGDKLYGLTTLHVLTKDVPNWFWATFHHKDAPANPFELFDAHGQPVQLKGTVWENYVLGGTQTDFVTSTGKASILSDHYIEFGFQKSSCITCHATAHGSPDGTVGPTQPMALALLRDKTGDDERGPPFPSWYLKDGKPFFMQTDFVYSIPFRARREIAAPPNRCLW